MSPWSNVALGEVLTKSDDWIQLDPEREYKEVTVRNRGQGAVLRRIVTGAEIAGTRRMRVHHRQFIVSRIDARHGSSGVIAAELEGAIVTNDFPVFDCDERVLLPEYLGWYTKTSQFVDECRQASEGSTNRVRLKESAFLEITMPLPPIEEQRRVVEKLNRLAESVSKITAAQKAIAASSSVLSRSIANLVFASVRRDSETMPLRELGAYVTSGPRSWSEHYAQAGDRFYRAQDIGPAGETADEAKQYLVPPAGLEGRHARVAPGDVLIVITGATVGRVAMIGPQHESGFVSQHVALCRVSNDVLLPEYLMCALLAPLGQDQLLASRYGQGKPGLNLASLLDLRVPRPGLDRQRDVVRDVTLQRKRDQTLKLRRRETGAEVEALLRVALSGAFQ